MEQLSIFDCLFTKYKINKPIRLTELFAGYGSQALSLKYLGIPFEHNVICEWAVNSIQAYKELHFTNDNIDYSASYTYSQLIDMLANYGISQDYNKPMTKEQIARKNESWCRKVYNNIIATHNLVDVSKAHLEFDPTYCNILTYSFPCQDLSLAGKMAGMKDTNTRSGLLWEVERILTECKNKPDVLLMENVPQVHGLGNVEDFNKWQLRLEELGYKNYWQDLNAKDYGIPQNRNRCFMVSLLGNYSYSFPKTMKLEKRLKDLLEDDVDEKYYLSDKIIQFYCHNEEEQKAKGNGFKFEYSNGDKIAKYLTTRAGSRMDDNYIEDKPIIAAKVELNTLEENKRCFDINGISPTLTAVKDGYHETKIVENKSLKETIKGKKLEDADYIDKYNKVIKKDISGTITTRVDARNNTFLAIKNATEKGYLEAHDGDGVDISGRMQYHRGTVQKGMTQTLSTMGGDNNGVVVKNENLRIRKLTPKECFRLMGVKDADFEKLSGSNANLYHLAGDSIVVNVLMAIFKEMI